MFMVDMIKRTSKRLATDKNKDFADDRGDFDDDVSSSEKGNQPEDHDHASLKVKRRDEVGGDSVAGNTNKKAKSMIGDQDSEDEFIGEAIRKIKQEEFEHRKLGSTSSSIIRTSYELESGTESSPRSHSVRQGLDVGEGDKDNSQYLSEDDLFSRVEKSLSTERLDGIRKAIDNMHLGNASMMDGFPNLLKFNRKLTMEMGIIGPGISPYRLARSEKIMCIQKFKNGGDQLCVVDEQSKICATSIVFPVLFCTQSNLVGEGRPMKNKEGTYHPFGVGVKILMPRIEMERFLFAVYHQTRFSNTNVGQYETRATLNGGICQNINKTILTEGITDWTDSSAYERRIAIDDIGLIGVSISLSSSGIRFMPNWAAVYGTASYGKMTGYNSVTSGWSSD
ncbi:hypothetical protein BC829DRAFT_423566 [Chytridium lagenaria]|nr:hypothetical protein BC829DRAFT_423566 [Chytridium lagenaria]